ncbi:GTP cyclohydrolase II [Streptomyces xanthophaeus]|uniref:GTP cyclohydrolase II n=1 Tax=Streptomyces xanthophaeus TaxID=67385 RepID=UPI003863480E|nr:GTP cyclohydrolase II [Streptomyces xanthophaeus]WST63878.1 GTP cyclohydrolase II [Streptomyces xanthophaeus]
MRTEGKDGVIIAPAESVRVRARVEVPIDVPGLGRRASTMVTFHGLHDGREHVALLMPGWQNRSHPLVRVHSECLTGDVFGSQRCDCGPQLHEALAICSHEGGIILYLRQEGRGIGLYNKFDAYVLQDSGLDTFEANAVLNFGHDMRDYRVAAEMLRALGVPDIRLLSNNPEKAAQLRAHGVAIAEVVTTGTFVNENNHAYLTAKRERAGHALGV